MTKYESKVQLPAVAGVQKPGAERYAVPGKVAEALQGELPPGEAAGAEWVDGRKLSVTVASETSIPDPELKEAQAAVQRIVGPESEVSPFEPESPG